MRRNENHSVAGSLWKSAFGLAGTWALVLAQTACGSSSSSTPAIDEGPLVAYLQSISDEVSGDSRYRVVVYDADFA
ncbi:MAG: hypothetical protein PVI24_13075 [Myxococcales bacterium]|jgi:hypothetical protein